MIRDYIKHCHSNDVAVEDGQPDSPDSVHVGQALVFHEDNFLGSDHRCSKMMPRSH